MTRRMPVLAAVVTAAIPLSACFLGDGPLTAHESVLETRGLDPTGEFSLENVNGGIAIATWSEPRVRIEAEKHALSSRALERVRVEIDGEGDRVAVRTRVDRGGTFFGRSGKVDYRITLPSRARLELETVNGTVEVDGVTGRMRVECVNGSVRIRRAAGEVTASTVNGAIRARYGPVEPGGRHRFSTTNGSIDVELPEKTGGRLEARTINGRVTCDLPLESREGSRRRLEGRLGPGNDSFKLTTVNGSIRVRRGAEEARAEGS